MRIARLKMRLDKHPGGRHFGYCNVWISERDSLDFTVYLTDFEQTIVTIQRLL
ncbi:frataxin-like iron-binding protein CyaY [Paraburkholderia sp. WC7.3d]